MSDHFINPNDERIDRILMQLVKYSQGEFSLREKVSDNGDQLDAIIIGLNTLGEEASASGRMIKDYEQRATKIMEVLLKYTLFDFSEKIEVSKVGDELDAIGIGLNTMAEELVSSREQEEMQIARITEANQFLDTIVENIPHMVFVKEAEELRFVRFNNAGEDLLGISRDELIGKNDHDLFPPEQALFFIQKDRECLEGKKIVDIPEERIHTSSGEKWLHTKKIPILDNAGNPVYLLGISEDITERKLKDERINNLNVELKNNVNLLKSINGELEAFTYSVSHDLRAPLRAIHGFTKIIEAEYISKLDDDAKGMMKHVMENARKMGQLIDDLLALSRFSKKELLKRPTDLTQLMQQCLSELKKSTDIGNAQITIDDLGMARIDPALMFQVFINLLSNAVKYSSYHEQPIIHVGCEPGLHETIYFVKDNGAGFDMKYYDKLFGVFQRLHSAEEFEGTGVGLALIKRIVTRHNGRVWAEAELGKGACFYIAMDTGH